MQNPICPRSLFGAPLDPIRSQLLEPALINILVLQVQVPNVLLLQVRDRLTDILIPSWVGIRLKARYSGSVQFPAPDPEPEESVEGQ